MIARVGAVCAAGIVALLATVSPASAAGVVDFDAPLLGSTASQHWSRLPDPADLLCGNGCDTGLLPGLASENGTAVYIPAGPASWGVLSDEPSLVGKVTRFYQGDGMFAGAQIIELKPGTAVEPVLTRLVRADITSTGAKPKKEVFSKTRQSDGWTVWLSEGVVPKGRSSDLFQSAYAYKGNEIVRVYCDGEIRYGGTFCGGLVDTALKIARTKPGPRISNQSAALVPKAPIPGLSPDFASSINSREYWGNTLEALPQLVNALGPETLAMQWSAPANPALRIIATVTTLTDQRGLKTFLADLCPSGASGCTRVRNLAPAPRGGLAAGMSARPEGETGDWALEFQAGDGQRILDVQCTAGDGYVRSLTTAERAACRRSIGAVSKAVFAG